MGGGEVWLANGMNVSLLSKAGGEVGGGGGGGKEGGEWMVKGGR